MTPDKDFLFLPLWGRFEPIWTFAYLSKGVARKPKKRDYVNMTFLHPTYRIGSSARQCERVKFKSQLVTKVCDVQFSFHVGSAPPEKNHKCPQTRDQFKRKCSCSNHWFFGNVLVFGGYVPLIRIQVIQGGINHPQYKEWHVVAHMM